MRVIVEADYEAVSDWAARHVAEAIAVAAPTSANPFVLGLPTGSTPVGLYDRLVELNRKGDLSFRHVVTFNMDEYVGLPANHPAGYHAFMWEHLFGRIDIPEANVNILDGNTADPQAECTAYEERIARFGGVDLWVGGLGANGHIAFNEPGSSLASRTRIVSLSHETILTNARFFGHDPDQVPRQALTVGVGTIMDGREVLVLVSGVSKAHALQHVLEGSIGDHCPAGAVRTHPRSTIVCDKAAAREMDSATIERFTNL